MVRKLSYEEIHRDNHSLKNTVDDLNSKVLLLSHNLELLLREKYGHKSECFSATGEV